MVTPFFSGHPDKVWQSTPTCVFMSWSHRANSAKNLRHGKIKDEALTWSTKKWKSAACDRGWEMFTSTVTTVMANTCDKRSKSAFRFFVLRPRMAEASPREEVLHTFSRSRAKATQGNNKQQDGWPPTFWPLGLSWPCNMPRKEIGKCGWWFPKPAATRPKHTVGPAPATRCSSHKLFCSQHLVRKHQGVAWFFGSLACEHNQIRANCI